MDENIEINEEIKELDLSIKENRRELAYKFVDALVEHFVFSVSFIYKGKTITVFSKLCTWLEDDLGDDEFIRLDMNKFIGLYKTLIKFIKGKEVNAKDEFSVDMLLLNYNDVSEDNYKATFKSEKDKKNGIVTHEIVFKNVKNIGVIIVRYEIEENKENEN